MSGNQRIIDEGIIVIGGATPAPAATATPEGVVLTIKSSVQNVRTGPSTAYDTLGQMRQGEQARVIGATIDFSWVVIQYRGQNGWLFTSLLDVFGDRTSLPVIPIPPTPTPGPPTPTPTAQPFADIVITSASPGNLTRGFPFTVVVTVLNQGPVGAGPFAVATTFEPDSAFSAVNLDGLGAGQQTTINLGATLNSSTGLYGIVIVADLNQQVDEGPGGEANNFDFVFNYKVDRPILNTGTLTLNPGGTLNLEGSGTVDLNWNGAGTSLDFIAPPAGSGMYLITDVAGINAVHYDKINPALATTHSLNVALLPNATIGIVTAEGNRGVLHVDNVTSGGPIVLTYRVYLP